LCAHLFVTSQTYDFARFRRALDSGNVTEALSAASALPHVGLVEALELVLLLCNREPRGSAVGLRDRLRAA
jgi:hypothetical protein